ncbi:MAG: S41 family peptidase [Pseudomonadota bacterium]
MALALLPAALLAAAPAGAAQAPAPDAPAPLDAARRRRVVETFSAALVDHYVFPDIGTRYAARLRERLRAGAYDDLTDAAAFSARVTADLQALSPDRHLAMIPARRAGRRPPDPAQAPASTRASGPPGLEDARMIGDVAYLRFNEFPGGASAADARAFLLAHADARALVIDCRPNRGGRLDEMNAILPLLYDRPSRLYRMEMRPGVASPFQSVPMVTPVPGKAALQMWDHTIVPDDTERRLRSVPVYYLTSRRTASAAEAMALGLRSTRRATLIGETTAGAGYFGGIFDVGDPALQAWISTGRTYDPATDWDWEGKGIRPDVETPVDDALTVALDMARRAAG